MLDSALRPEPLIWLAERRWTRPLLRRLLPFARELNGLTADGRSLSELLVGLNDALVIKALMRTSWDPASPAVSGWTAPTVACDMDALDSLRAMLAAGVSPDVRNTNQTTALMIAARQNKLEHMEMLLEAKAAPNLADRQGWTAAHWCVHKNRPLTIEVLEKLRSHGADLLLEDLGGRTCFDLDSDYGEQLQALRESLRR